MTRRVQECDTGYRAFWALDGYTKRTNVLRNPTGLTGSHRRRTQRIQQRRLTVIDMAHDRHDRWPQRKCGALLRRRRWAGVYIEFRVLLRSDHDIVLGGNELGVLEFQEPVWACVVKSNLLHSKLELSHMHSQNARKVMH